MIVHGAAWDHANARAQEEAKQPGCAIVHPFDNPLVWSVSGRVRFYSLTYSELTHSPKLVCWVSLYYVQMSTPSVCTQNSKSGKRDVASQIPRLLLNCFTLLEL